MNPLLSIVIPTKDRYETLFPVVKAIIKYIDGDDFEIVIQDNSSSNINVIDRLMEIDKKKIKYNYLKETVSVSENSNIAIQNSTGDFVLMIGDDDSLSKYFFDAVNFMKANDVDALNSPFAHYVWPDIQSRMFKKSFSGKMEIFKFNGKIREITIEYQIEKLLSTGGTSLVELPRMYYGIVKRDIIEKVKNISGNYIPGPSPDMANAVSIVMFTTKMYYVDFPLFIAGNSFKSTAGMGAKGQHIGKIEEISFLPKDCASNWSSLVPKYWSGPTIWAESALKALERSVILPMLVSMAISGCLFYIVPIFGHRMYDLLLIGIFTVVTLLGCAVISLTKENKLIILNKVKFLRFAQDY